MPKNVQEFDGARPRIVLASSRTSPQELSTSILWFNGVGLDIRPVRSLPYRSPASTSCLQRVSS